MSNGVAMEDVWFFSFILMHFIYFCLFSPNFYNEPVIFTKQKQKPIELFSEEKNQRKSFPAQLRGRALIHLAAQWPPWAGSDHLATCSISTFR